MLQVERGGRERGGTKDSDATGRERREGRRGGLS